MNTKYEILEVNYAVSPGGVDTFEVYDTNLFDSPPVYESEDLTDAVKYCYNKGFDFTVRTFAQYERDNY